MELVSSLEFAFKIIDCNIGTAGVVFVSVVATSGQNWLFQKLNSFALRKFVTRQQINMSHFEADDSFTNALREFMREKLNFAAAKVQLNFQIQFSKILVILFEDESP
jgi:hypothetical protein